MDSPPPARKKANVDTVDVDESSALKKTEVDTVVVDESSARKKTKVDTVVVDESSSVGSVCVILFAVLLLSIFAGLIHYHVKGFLYSVDQRGDDMEEQRLTSFVHSKDQPKDDVEQQRLTPFVHSVDQPRDDMKQERLTSIFRRRYQPRDDVEHQRLTSFLHSVDRLNESFISQDAMTWTAIASRGYRHVTSPDPIQPAVFLLASVPGTEDATDCLARSLANAFLASENNSPVVIRGETLRERDGHEAKKEMDEILNRNLSSLSDHSDPLPVAVIEDIHHLPAPSPMLFFSYCDNQDAPVRRAVFVFTVKMPTAPKPGLNPVQKEGFVLTYLTENLWTLEKNRWYSEDTIEALVTRLSDVTILVSKETKPNLARVCRTL